MSQSADDFRTDDRGSASSHGNESRKKFSRLSFDLPANRLRRRSVGTTKSVTPQSVVETPTESDTLAESSYQSVKGRLHEELLDELSDEEFSGEAEELLTERIEEFVARVLDDDDLPLNDGERRQLADDLRDEVLGVGPLAPLMADPAVTDILVVGPMRCYVERFGKVVKTAIRFRDSEHLVRVIQRIAARVGRRIDESSPMVDARLPDGSRVNATLPPVTIDGPTLSIRRFGRRRLKRADLLRLGMYSPEMMDFLELLVRHRHNLLIAGGTGAGKSTFLGAVCEAIPDDERIITIEDAAELMLDQEHVVRKETRPANLEGQGRITARDLVVNSLRMRPDRIIVGEVRGGEALDMLQAMNTGHDGSLTTIHANNSRDALKRLETMVLMAEMDLPSRAIREQIASAIEFIVFVKRCEDGVRRVD
ncbi:MAG: CpaF family protein, partial [Planctomycetota bacterium]